MEKICVAIDLGNSQTRMSVLYDDQWTDMSFSNRFVHLKEGYDVPIEYQNNETLIFSSNGLYYGYGQIVSREFTNAAIKPTAIRGKTEQISSTLSLNLIFIEVYRWLAAKLGKPLEQLEIEFEVFVLLPASEHTKSSDVMVKLINDIKEIGILSPVMVTRPVNVTTVKVLSEGVSAYMGAMYELSDNGDITEREANKKFLTGETLVIDIGAGTTDISLIKDSSVILNSKESFREGGNAVESACKNNIHNDYDYYPSDEAIAGLLKNGILLKGAKEIEAEEYLNNAKHDFGLRLNNFLIAYLERHGVELRDLKGLLVTGGGALQTERNGAVVSPAMCDILIKFIQEVTDSVELVSTVGCNPRNLNLDGLKLFICIR